MPWHELDSRVHFEIIRTLIENGRPPALAELARAAETDEGDLTAALLRLANNHALVLHPGTTRVWVIHPFSLSPTSTWVESARHRWWAPCLWCAFGVAALVPGDVIVHALLGSDFEPVRFEVRNGQLGPTPHLVHFPIPPRKAWANVHHFCASVLPFRSDGDARDWSARHAQPVGELIPASDLFTFARAWYGRHADRDWIKWSGAQARHLFAEAGLTGEFWALDPSDERY